MGRIFRSFWVMLRRFRLASALNIIGLSVAFAAFIVIVAQVRHEQGFDRSHPKGERLYRLTKSADSITFTPFMSRQLLDLARTQVPQVEAASIYSAVGVPGKYLTLEKNGQPVGFNNQEGMGVYPAFLDMFDFRIVEGTRADFDRPGALALPRSAAERYFGAGESAVGKQLDFQTEKRTVALVYADFPANTWMRNIIYASRDPEGKVTGPGIPDWIEDWNNANTMGFLLLHPGASAVEAQEALLGAYRRLIADGKLDDWAAGDRAMRLTPIDQVYYDYSVKGDYLPKGSEATTWTLLSIAILIVVIAGINFVNFATSLAPVRIKSINTQKVLGSPTSTLRASLIFESIGICLIAFALSLLWVYSLQELGFTALLTADITLGANVGLLALTLGVALAVGLVAGLYPAWYTTSFPPALVLKGSFGMSPQGKKLRTALVGFQFVVSIGLIIAALFMQVQNSFLRGVDTGMETEQVMVAQLTPEIITKHRHTLEEQLREGPQIVQVAYAGAVFGTGDQATMGFGRQNKLGEMINFDVIQASWSFPEVLGLKVVEGRTFRPEDEQKDRESYVFNQTAGRLLDLHEGDPIDGAPVVGIVGDYNYKSLRVGIDPMAIVVNLGFADDWMSFLYIRFSGDPQPAMEHVRRTVRAIDPTFPVEFQFFDAVFNETYQKERKMTGLITGFSLLAVIISLVGVFGLVVFETQYRKKEIGVRRVHGATVGEILAMFNRRFVWIVAICFLVAAPLAWYGITEWLGNFAYRTPLHWWVFACSLLVVLLITLLTVTVQSWRAATTNPVESLKTE